MAATGWSDLPSELLTDIAGGLTELADIACFRSVCSSWRAAVGAATAPPLQPPWLNPCAAPSPRLISSALPSLRRGAALTPRLLPSLLRRRAALASSPAPPLRCRRLLPHPSAPPSLPAPASFLPPSPPSAAKTCSPTMSSARCSLGWGPRRSGMRSGSCATAGSGLRIQSFERRRLRARAGPAMLRRLAARFPGVLELDLSQSPSRSFYPGVIDDDLDVIAGGFRNLRVLTLQNCKGITDVGLVKLGDGLPSLRSLDVSHCRKLSDKGLRAVALGCQSLRQLHITGCRLITDNLFLALSKSCLSLEELGAAGCNSITDAGISALADGCHNIKSLDISKCNKVGDLGLCKISDVSSSSLVSLKLLDCINVGDKSIYSLAKYCHNLETLVIGGCRDVSDESIEALALACCSSLRSLRMDWCLKITETSLRSVLSNCKLLVALDVGCCDQITDSAFQCMEANEFQSELRILKTSNCVRITVAGVSSVIKSCKALEYLDVRSCPQVTRQSCEQAGLQFPGGCKVNFEGSLTESDPSVDRFF